MILRVIEAQRQQQMPAPLQIDLNCDLGEGESPAVTESLMRHITSCNIACGGHFGDESSMRATALLALKYGVAVGAHPSFEDRQNFGRKVLPLDEAGLQALLEKQAGAMKKVLDGLGLRLHHIKLHGALYHWVERDEKLARAYAKWTKQHFPNTPLLVLSGGCVAKVARELDVRIAKEVFADRAYNDDGMLVSRERAGALLEDLDEICDRAARMVTEKRVQTISGKTIPIDADTICVHGDSPKSVQIVTQLRQALEQSGVLIVAF
jgi:UPF0271 protein